MTKLNKRRFALNVVVELLHTFALVNFMIWVLNWVGIVTVHVDYKLGDIRGLVIIAGIYLMSFVLKVWNLKGSIK